MYIKVSRPPLGTDTSENIDTLLSYCENLKEEISFRLDILSKRLDDINICIEKMKGDVQ